MTLDNQTQTNLPPLPAPSLRLALRGTVQDSSGRNNTPVATNVAMVSDSVFGQCASFNGTDSQISFKGLSCPSVFTFSAWVNRYPDLNTDIMTLLEYGDNQPLVGIQNGHLVAVIPFGTRIATLDGGLLAAEWTHIAVTRDELTASLYVNGQLVRVLCAEFVTTGVGLGIGHNQGNRYFRGSLAEVAVFEACLLPDAIRQLMAATKSGAPISAPQAVPPVKLDAPVLWNLVMPGFDPNESLTAAAQEFYKHYGDDYDFIVMVSDPGSEFIGGFNWKVRQPLCPELGFTRDNVGGLNDGPDYGSPARLKGVIWLPLTLDDRWGPPTINHEFLHYWGIQLKTNIADFGTEGGHWGYASTHGALGGFDVSTLRDANGQPITDPLSVGPGSKIQLAEFGAESTTIEVPYSPIELYLMGLVNKEDIEQNIFVMKNPVFVETIPSQYTKYYEDRYQPNTDVYQIDGFTKITLAELIALNGGVPPKATQTSFRAAWVLVTSAPATSAELAKAEGYARLCGGLTIDRPPCLQERLADQVRTYFRPKGEWSANSSIPESYFGPYRPRAKYLSFAEAAGGRATMDVRLIPKTTTG